MTIFYSCWERALPFRWSPWRIKKYQGSSNTTTTTTRACRCCLDRRPRPSAEIQGLAHVHSFPASWTPHQHNASSSKAAAAAAAKFFIFCTRVRSDNLEMLVGVVHAAFREVFAFSVSEDVYHDEVGSGDESFLWWWVSPTNSRAP